MEGLSELAPDRPASDHRQTLRSVGKVEDRLVGAKPGLRETRNRRNEGASARRDHRLLEPELRELTVAIHRDRVRTREGPISDEDVDVELVPIAFHRIFARDPRARRPHAVHRLAEVQLRAVDNRKAQALCLSDFRCHAGGANHALRRYTPDIETIAPQELSFDESNPCPERRRDQRRDQPGASGTEHHEVVTVCRNRVPVVRGMHERKTQTVVLVPGENTRK